MECGESEEVLFLTFVSKELSLLYLAFLFMKVALFYLVPRRNRPHTLFMDGIHKRDISYWDNHAMKRPRLENNRVVTNSLLRTEVKTNPNWEDSKLGILH